MQAHRIHAVIIIDNINMFVAIFWVVLLDFIFWRNTAIKRHEFKTKKAIKIVYYLSTYWAIPICRPYLIKAHPAYIERAKDSIAYSYFSNYIRTKKMLPKSDDTIPNGFKRIVQKVLINTKQSH